MPSEKLPSGCIMPSMVFEILLQGTPRFMNSFHHENLFVFLNHESFLYYNNDGTSSAGTLERYKISHDKTNDISS